MRKAVTALALAVGASFIVAGPASADDYVGRNPQGSVSSGSIPLGGTVQFAADCFVAGSSVTVSVSGPASPTVTTAAGSRTASATAVTDVNGDISAAVEPPAPGAYQVTAKGPRTCGTGEAGASFQVVSAGQTFPLTHTQAGGLAAATARPGAGSGGPGSDAVEILPRAGVDNIALQAGLGGALVAAGIGVVYLVRHSRRSN